MSGKYLRRAGWLPSALAAMLALLLLLAPSVALAQDDGGDVAPAAADGRINDNTLEFGVWWVEDYPPAGAGGSDLPATRPDALGLRDYLTSNCKTRLFGICFVSWPSPQWTARFVYGNTNAWSTDWRRSANGGSENSYIDTIDLAYFAGHGSASGIIFGVGSPTPVTVSKNDALGAWGDRDLDWIGLAACNVLDDPVSNLQGWGEAMNGVRLILGFKTVMNDVAHGVEFGKAIRDGYTFTQAWFRAADKLQSQNRVARVLAEQQAYFDDRPAQHTANTVVDWPKYYRTHTVGSEPARFVDAAAINYQMPILRVQPLSLSESVQLSDTLGTAFGVTVSLPISDGKPLLDVAFSLDGQLEMDVEAGLFIHTDMANLWKTESELSVMAAAGAAMQAIDNDAAKRIADAFLQQHQLTREDAHFYEVAEDTLTTMDQAVTASGETVVTFDERTTNYQVIYSRRIISSPNVSAGAVSEPVEFSVMGPGSKFKIYVATEAPVTASFADFVNQAVIGGMGGYRQIQTPAQAAAAGQLEMVSMLPEATIAKLFVHFEKYVALDQIPLSPEHLISREIVSTTPAYWEGPIGFGQTELIPVYALEVKNTLSDTVGGTYVVSSTTYIPVEPSLMAPLARISTTADLNEPVTPGATIVFEALDASKTLLELGLDPDPNDGSPLNFVLGSGEVTYAWYLNEVSEETQLGVERILNYVADPTKDFEGKDGGFGAQRILLVVTDTGKESEPFTSQAVVTLQSVPPLYLPAVQK
jgi:hypothetical protein